MSQNFTGRTAPNVSQYLQGLNELPAPGHIQNDFTFDDAFDIANVDFLDLDAAGFGDPTSFEPDNTKDGECTHLVIEVSFRAHMPMLT